ncbi:beta-carotene 15,15'-monooxygenase [Streptococcus sciuri]|uniref:Beta-carotene 15,15'-monooxygenase n=1 Tax=Streptococcus sciuri TaxID=2973939 RepID=A0ABT2F9Q3_9STRE|nr:beta-carotene 15,15'-monooxygenase [Streptococcus sciuri]MCS4488741.1 beta-carotene 15,15'-monooxygenase [Streptococcus sciuri]
MFEKILGLTKRYWVGVVLLNGVMLVLGISVIENVFDDMPFLKYIASYLSAFFAFGDILILIALCQSVRQHSRFLQNTYLKLLISTHISLIYNICYVFFAISVGFFTKSSWYFIYALYHFIFALSKSSIVRFLHKENSPIFFWQLYRRLGYFLILSAIIFHLVVIFVSSGRDNVHIQYPFMVYFIALMTFINLISSLVHLLSSKSNRSPQLRSVRPINFATSLFSLFFLQTMLLRLYGKGEPNFQRLMTILLGTSIFFILIILGISMIVIAHHNFKIIKKAEA